MKKMVEVVNPTATITVAYVPMHDEYMLVEWLGNTCRPLPMATDIVHDGPKAIAGLAEHIQRFGATWVPTYLPFVLEEGTPDLPKPTKTTSRPWRFVPGAGVVN